MKSNYVSVNTYFVAAALDLFLSFLSSLNFLIDSRGTMSLKGLLKTFVLVILCGYKGLSF